jgi:hypothetical protein
MTPTPAVPITHPSHPFWAGFNWNTVFQIIQIAAVAAPIIVTAVNKDPNAQAEASTLSGLAGQIAAGLNTPSA